LASEKDRPPRLRTSETGGPLPAKEVRRQRADRTMPDRAPRVRIPAEPPPEPVESAPRLPAYPKIGGRTAPDRESRDGREQKPRAKADPRLEDKRTARLPAATTGKSAKAPQAPAAPGSRRRTIIGAVIVLALLGGLVILPNALRSTTIPAGTIASFFAREVRYWSNQIGGWAQQYRLDPNLIATLMQIESCGHPEVVSSAGAQGLFQVMPFHFTEDEKARMTDPELNAKRGLAFITECLNWADGDVGLAMACYNGGPGLISQPQAYWPDETRRYYTWGSGIYGDAQRGATDSPTLDAWLDAGGWSLCQRASAALGLPTSTPFISPARSPTLPPVELPTMAIPPSVTPGGFVPTALPPGYLPTFDASGAGTAR
jgi:hypothetical protein